MSRKDLIVWKKPIQVVKRIYLITDKFPDSEKFGLTSQLRRASISITLDTAEDYSRRSARERRQFIALARGSVSEILKMLAGLSKSLNK